MPFKISRGGIWTLLNTTENTNTGTALDTGVVSVPSYNLYKILAQLQNYVAGNNGIQLYVNGDSSANYDRQQLANGAISTITGDTKFLAGTLAANEDLALQILLRGSNMATNPTNTYPTFAAFLGSNITMQGFTSGYLKVNYNDITSIQFRTSLNATGRVKIYGMNLT